jgi:hypothetical protein
MLYMSQMSIAQEVNMYLQRKPYLLEAMEKGIVNYSALARKIAKDLEDASVEAIKVTSFCTKDRRRTETARPGCS